MNRDATILVSEVLDPHTRKLVAALDNSDYVMSNDILSAVLAQIAECRAMNSVIAELLAEDGNEIYLRPARKYAHAEESLCFWDIMARARRHHEVRGGEREREVEREREREGEREGERERGSI